MEAFGALRDSHVNGREEHLVAKGNTRPFPQTSFVSSAACGSRFRPDPKSMSQ